MVTVFSRPPELSPEILDLVLDKMTELEDPKDRKRSLDAMALTSRRFRTPAQRYIFRKIRFKAGTYHNNEMDDGSPVVLNKAHELWAMLEADPQLPLTGVVSFIRSCHVDWIGSWDVIESINDGALATIISNLFKSINNERSGLHTCSFGLSVDIQYGHPSLRWIDFEPVTLAAFNQMLSNSALTSLYLANFEDVPPSLFRKSFLEHVGLRYVEILELFRDNDDDSKVQPSSTTEEADSSFVSRQTCHVGILLLVWRSR